MNLDIHIIIMCIRITMYIYIYRSLTFSWLNSPFFVEISWGFPSLRQGAMEKVGHFTWASNVSLSKYTRAKFAPYVGGDGMGDVGWECAVEVGNGYV